MYKLVIVPAFLMLISCNQKKHEPAPEQTEISLVDSLSENFFPVTNYIKGQVKEMAIRGINPVKYVSAGNLTDSSWIKIEDLEKEIAPFLNPVIDSSNLKPYYSERKFLDQTVNAYTFTYDPKGELPAGYPILHWDVYVDPVSFAVKRVYILKQNGTGEKTQLTWVADKYCKMVTISDNKDQPAVVKEVLLKWDF